MNIIIIDNHIETRDRLCKLLRLFCLNTTIIGCAESITQGTELINSSDPDLIFIDVEIFNKEGYSFFFNFQNKKFHAVFTLPRNYSDLERFTANTIDYLLKPIDQNLLEKSLEKFDRMKSSFLPTTDLREVLKSIQPEGKNYKSRFLVRSRDKLVSIKTQEIAYFYLENGMVYLVTTQENKFLFDKPLDQIEVQLNPEYFFRLNRQVLANIEAITSSYAYDKGKLMVELQPKTPSPTIVSRERSSEFKRWLDLG